MRHAPRRFLPLRAFLPWLLCAALPLDALAGIAGPNLANLANQKRHQSQLGLEISNQICPNANAASGGDRLNGNIGDLFGRCNDLIHTANQVNGNGDMTNSLGLDADGTNDALSNIAHLQQPAVGRSITEIGAVPAAVTGNRIVALRQGASGIQIAGHLVDSDGNRIALDHDLLAEASAAGSETPLPSGLGLYLNTRGGFGDRNGQSEELGFDYHEVGFMAGGDYRFSDRVIGGMALGYNYSQREFSGNRGEIRGNALLTSFYAGYQDERIFADFLYSYSYHVLDVDRNIFYTAPAPMGMAMGVDRKAQGETDAHEHLLAANAGYEFRAGGVSFGPLTRLEYINLKIDDFRESGAMGLNLAYDDDTVHSLIYNLGLQASYPISTEFGVVTPQLRAEWAHQFEDDSRTITARYRVDASQTEFFVETRGPDRDYVELAGSVAVTFAEGRSAFLGYEALVGHRDLSAHLFTVGGRIEF